MHIVLTQICYIQHFSMIEPQQIVCGHMKDIGKLFQHLRYVLVYIPKL